MKRGLRSCGPYLQQNTLRLELTHCVINYNSCPKVAVEPPLMCLVRGHRTDVLREYPRSSFHISLKTLDMSLNGLWDVFPPVEPDVIYVTQGNPSFVACKKALVPKNIDFFILKTYDFLLDNLCSKLYFSKSRDCRKSTLFESYIFLAVITLRWVVSRAILWFSMSRGFYAL